MLDDSDEIDIDNMADGLVLFIDNFIKDVVSKFSIPVSGSTQISGHIRIFYILMWFIDVIIRSLILVVHNGTLDLTEVQLSGWYYLPGRSNASQCTFLYVV